MPPEDRVREVKPLSYGQVAPIRWRGMTLIPKIETVSTSLGPKAKTKHGIAIVKRDQFGRVIFALPGGGEFIR